MQESVSTSKKAVENPMIPLCYSELPMSYRDAVLPVSLFKSRISRLKGMEDNKKASLRRALALHVHRNLKLEEKTSKVFSSCILRVDGLPSVSSRESK